MFAQPTKVILTSLAVLLAAGTAALPVPTAGRAAVAVAPPEGFAHPAIREAWQREDGQVASGRLDRAWLYGPGPFYTEYEPNTAGPDGNMLVQYFDKARLEVSDPRAEQDSPWFVASGLLVKEMMTGKAETGQGNTINLGRARVALVGDNPDAQPTYADFGVASYTDRAPDLTGKTVSCVFGGGAVSPQVQKVLSRFEPASGHNWAEPFRRYASERLGERWLQVLGYPLTEPCAVQTTIGGKGQTVLVQLFERRVLTYNPANSPATQVEMGNVGRHYFQWRHSDTHEASLQARYDVALTVGAAPTRQIDIEMSLTWKNTTPARLDRAVFRAVWNNWKGALTLREAQVGGKSAATRWLHGINLEVQLPEIVEPGDEALIVLRLSLKPRPVGGRTGYDRSNDILSLGDMLPTLVPWENGGWLYYPYSELGDHGYYATSEYSVIIRSAGAERLVVGGTGRVVAVNATGTEWRFAASNVRDVAYVVSPRFIDPLKDSGMARTVGKTKMLAYFTPAQRAAVQRQLELTAPALRWFSEKLGQYPETSYTIAEMGVPLERTDNYAQEYPMSYFIPSSWLALGTAPGSWTWYIPVHEVGHQWFYSMVGNNQLTHPWLDEALTTYITAEYVRANYPEQYARAWSSMTQSATGARPVSSGVFSGFANEQAYSATVYDAASLMLDRVRKSMGDEQFYTALREYVTTYSGKRATPFALMSTFQKHTQSNLKAIFTEYLGY